MSKKNFIWTFLFMAFISYSQQKEDVNNNFKWFINYGAGKIMNNHFDSSAEIPDILTQPKLNRPYFIHLSVDAFLKSNFGLFLAFNNFSIIYKNNINRDVLSSLKEKYPGYYFKILSSNVDEKSKLTTDFQIGISYYLNLKRFFFIPRLKLNVYKDLAGEMTIRLKEKNHNTYYLLTYTPLDNPDKTKINLAFVPSISMGYILPKNWTVNLGIDYMLYRKDVGYKLTKTNMATGYIIEQKNLNSSHPHSELRIFVTIGKMIF